MIFLDCLGFFLLLLVPLLFSLCFFLCFQGFLYPLTFLFTLSIFPSQFSTRILYYEIFLFKYKHFIFLCMNIFYSIETTFPRHEYFYMHEHFQSYVE
jgi:hypothetical protein